MKLTAGRGQSGHGAVVQMGGLDTLRQRVTDICTGYFIVVFRDRQSNLNVQNVQAK